VTRRELAASFVLSARVAMVSRRRLRRLGCNTSAQLARAEAFLSAAWSTLGKTPLRDKLARAKWLRENGRRSTVVLPDNSQIEVLG
jgi:hypothetical protein